VQKKDISISAINPLGNEKKEATPSKMICDVELLELNRPDEEVSDTPIALRESYAKAACIKFPRIYFIVVSISIMTINLSQCFNNENNLFQ
jgi:hypothetical protein